MTPAELLAAIKAAPGPSAELDKAIAELLGVNAKVKTFLEYSNSEGQKSYSRVEDVFPNLTGSLDATKAAIKARWPNCRIAVGEGDIADAMAALWINKDVANDIFVEKDAPDLERALCAALVAALMEEGK